MRIDARFVVRCLLMLAGMQIGILGCENGEAKARYVKAPLESIPPGDRASLNAAISEARTRLLTVRGRQLRADLSADLEDEYARAMDAIEDAEKAEAEKKDAEKREAARIEAEARQRAIEQEQASLEFLERQRKAEAEEKRDVVVREPIDVDPIRAREAAVKAQRLRAKEAVTNLEVHMRNSALGDGTKVLVLRNAKPYAVDFDLRCYTSNDAANRTLPITVPAGGEKRVGFLQGWCGNFTPGQRCEAYVDGELLWNYEIP